MFDTTVEIKLLQVLQFENPKPREQNQHSHSFGTQGNGGAELARPRSSSNTVSTPVAR